MGPGDLHRIAICIALGTAALAVGAEVAPLAGERIALGQAIRLAIANNPELAQSLADVQIAQGRALEAAGIDDFVLEAGPTWQAYRPALIPGQFGQPPLNSLGETLSLTRSLPTGGRVGVHLGTDWGNAAPFAVGLGSSPAFGPSLLLTISHPLLKGVGPNIARADRRKADVGRSAAALRRDAAAAELLRDVSQAYWALAFAGAERDIRQSSVALAMEQLRAVQAYIAVGKQPPSASAEVEVAVALRQEEAFLADEDLRHRSLELGRLTSGRLNANGPVWLAAERPESSPRPQSAERALALAMERNSELHAAHARSQAASIDVEVAQNGLLPELDVAVSASPEGIAVDPALAVQQLVRFDGYNLQAGVIFRLPIGQSAARGRATMARETLRKAHLEEIGLVNRIREGVLSAVGAIGTATQREALLAKTVELAALDLEAERARFAGGRGTSFDVLRRQDDLARAQLRLARAKTDFLRSQAALEALTAEILRRHGLEGRFNGHSANDNPKA